MEIAFSPIQAPCSARIATVDVFPHHVDDLVAPAQHPTVVDASVGVKWVVRESNSSQALDLLNGDRRLIVPDRFFSEVTDVFWKRTRRLEPSERITVDQARNGLTYVPNVPLEAVPSAMLLINSLEIALEAGHPTYDCDYLALAFTHGADFVTADEKLYRKFFAHPKYGTLLRWVDPFNSPR